jgi:spore coat polysaccharide biosynthesis predicted glycosyltransferase SpsG
MSGAAPVPEKTPIRILFRARGNHAQGMGDLHGAWALAAEFSARGCDTAVLAEPDSEAVSFLQSAGLTHIPAHNTARDAESAAVWRPDAVIFNLLKNDPEYFARFRDAARLLVTLDDDGPAAALADLRFNPLYPTPHALTGPEYIYLKPAFQERHDRPRVWNEAVARVLVTLGGADTYGFTPRVAEALDVLPRGAAVDVVLGPAFRHGAELEAVLRKSNRVFAVARAVDDMPERLFRADLTVCSAGLTLFEAACVGTPAVVVCGELFEVPTAARLQALGFGVNLGFGESVSVQTIRDAVSALCHDAPRRRAMGLRGRELIDGRGAARTAGAILKRLLT